MTAPEFPDSFAAPFTDDVQAAGDDLRDGLHWETLIDRDLIVKDPRVDGWRPDPKDLA